MNVNYNYPKPNKIRQIKKNFIRITKYLFLFIGFISLVLNIVIKGSAWSIVVIYSLYFIHNTFIARSLFEYNFVSQSIKVITHSCILLIILGIIYQVEAMLLNVVPYTILGVLIILAILYFTDIEGHKRNIFPIVWFSVISLILSAVYIINPNYNDWEYPILAALSFSFLMTFFISLRGDFIIELKKRFHTK